MTSVTVIYHQEELIVSGELYPGMRGEHTLSNGDPGYPDIQEEFSIKSIELGGVDILPFLLELPCNEQYMQDLEDLCLSKI